LSGTTDLFPGLLSSELLESESRNGLNEFGNFSPISSNSSSPTAPAEIAIAEGTTFLFFFISSNASPIFLSPTL
jgi:hypothetical protein